MNKYRMVEQDGQLRHLTPSGLQQQIVLMTLPEGWLARDVRLQHPNALRQEIKLFEEPFYGPVVLFVKAQ